MFKTPSLVKQKFLIFLKILFTIILFSFCNREKHAKSKPLKLTAKAYYVSDLVEKKVLFERDSKLTFPSARTIKLFTGYYSKEFLNYGQLISIPKEATNLHPLASKADLKKGESFTYKDLLYSMLISSANDASIAIAISVHGSEKKFAKKITKWMNKKNFVNSNAFDSTGISSETVTSASDLGQLLEEISINPDFYEILFLPTLTISSSKGRKILLNNRNKLTSYKNFKIGGKTGSLKKAGQCFAGFIKDQSHFYGIAILGSTSYVEDLKQLIDSL